MTTCPGWYCGRELLSSGEFGDCGSCPRGFRRNMTTHICEECQDSPMFYDWLYLGFMVLLALVLHWFFIDLVAMRRRYYPVYLSCFDVIPKPEEKKKVEPPQTATPSTITSSSEDVCSDTTPLNNVNNAIQNSSEKPKKGKPLNIYYVLFSFNKDVIVLHFTAFIEIILASILTLLSTHPIGSFRIQSCNVRNLSDWYTLLHNPIPNYEKRIHCTQEAVYPLYTAVFVFYAYCLVLMLLIRPWVCRKFLPRQSKMSIYAAMYFIPILTVFHALIGGLLYYSFPYLIVILSVISCAAHFAIKIDQSVLSLIITTVVDPRNVIILIGHWMLHAYGIVAITQLTNPTLHALLILLVPLPALFYIFTARFTDPSKFTF